jgi:hypothetical protein
MSSSRRKRGRPSYKVDIDGAQLAETLADAVTRGGGGGRESGRGTTKVKKAARGRKTKGVLQQCVVCNAPGDEAQFFNIMSTRTTASNLLLAFKVYDVLHVDLAGGWICSLCHDLLDQVDFFEQNAAGTKQKVKDRQGNGGSAGGNEGGGEHLDDSGGGIGEKEDQDDFVKVEPNSFFGDVEVEEEEDEDEKESSMASGDASSQMPDSVLQDDDDVKEDLEDGGGLDDGDEDDDEDEEEDGSSSEDDWKPSKKTPRVNVAMASTSRGKKNSPSKGRGSKVLKLKPGAFRGMLPKTQVVVKLTGQITFGPDMDREVLQTVDPEGRAQVSCVLHGIRMYFTAQISHELQQLQAFCLAD